MILKYQFGGKSHLISYTPPPIAKPQKTSAPEKSGESFDLTSGDIFKLLKDVNLLPSDHARIIQLMGNFPLNTTNASKIASAYNMLQHQINNAKFSMEKYKEARNQVSSNKGLREVAITLDGRLICTDDKGDYKYIEPKNLKEHEGYRPLTNLELLDLRSDKLATEDNILTVVMNGVGLPQVQEHIQKILDKLGQTKTTESGYLNTNEKIILTGIQAFSNALSKVSGNDFNPTVDNLYRYNIIETKEKEQIEAALIVLSSMLEENEKALLEYKSLHLKGGINTLIGNMIAYQLKPESSFNLTLKLADEDSTGAKKSSDSSDSTDKIKLDPVSMLRHGYGQKSVITIQTKGGIDKGLEVPTIQMPIVTKEGNSMGTQLTLNDVSQSAFGGYLNFQEASMGGVRIDFMGTDKVFVNGSALHIALLPVDMKKLANGEIMPDIDMLERYKLVSKKIEQEKITDKETINKIYKEANLPILYTDKGDITTNYMEFGLLSGYALDSAFKDEAGFSEWLTEVTNEKEIENVINSANNKRSKENHLDFSYDSWMVPDSWESMSHLYKGIVFIPTRSDYFTGSAATGNYPTVGQAEKIEALQQAAPAEKYLNNVYNKPKNEL